eukprot:2062797-Amphidinium_carterae.1
MPIQAFLRKAASKHVVDESFRAMLDAREDHEELFREVLSKVEWHPAIGSILYEFSPVAVIDAMITTSESNEAVLCDARPSDVNGVMRSVKILDKSALMFWQTKINLETGSGTLNGAATDATAALRARTAMKSGFAFMRYDSFNVLGSVTIQTSKKAATIEVFPGRVTANELYLGSKRSSIRRTTELASPVLLSNIGLDRRDPVIAALCKAI